MVHRSESCIAEEKQMKNLRNRKEEKKSETYRVVPSFVVASTTSVQQNIIALPTGKKNTPIKEEYQNKKERKNLPVVEIIF